MDRTAVPVSFHFELDQDEFRMTCRMRVLLASAVLAVTAIDPSEPSRFVVANYAILTAYLAHATILYIAALRNLDLPASLHRSLHWIDVSVYLTLIGLSGGSNSTYFTLLFFAILVASLRWGFTEGLGMTVVSVLLFGLTAFATQDQSSGVDLNRFLLRTASLPILGYLIAYRGGFELRLRRRVALLGELSAVSNPRLGRNHALDASLERLRRFYDADVCVAILVSREGDGFEIRRTQHVRAEVDPRTVISEDLAKSLLAPGQDEILFFQTGSRWRGDRLSLTSTGGRTQGDDPVASLRCRDVSEILDVPAFISVPLRLGAKAVGRLFLGARVPRFDSKDGAFLLQAADQLMPMLDYVDLVDRMATKAASDERQRIALDIHDRLIQSYIGVQMGVTGLDRLVRDRSPQARGITEGVAQLLTLTSKGIAELRDYVQELRVPVRGAELADRLRHFAELFGDATGISVSVQIAENVRLNDRLTAEVFSMATEGVSNVRRHTAASRVDVEVSRRGTMLVVRIRNPVEDGSRPEPFVPRSLSQRAAALGGTVRVETTVRGQTAVIVEIPL
jgi:signal transduction histidine kinase